MSLGRSKLLSINVAPCYLDPNYTCQLSLSPHLSLSFEPHTLRSSVLDETARSFSSFLYSRVTALRVSQY